MPSVDVLDETFVVAPPRSLAVIFRDAERCRRFWPDLRLSVYADRGDEGLRWTVRGALVGTMEVWLEPVLDGTVLHYYLRADPAGPDGTALPAAPRAAVAEIRRRQLAAKRLAFALKDELEADREIGLPAPAAGGPGPIASGPIASGPIGPGPINSGPINSGPINSTPR